MARNKILFLSEGNDKYLREMFEQSQIEATIVYNIVEFYEVLKDDKAGEISLFVVGLFVALPPRVADYQQRIAAAGLADFKLDSRPTGLNFLRRLASEGRLDKTVVLTTIPDWVSESGLSEELHGRVCDTCYVDEFREFLLEQLQSA